MPVNMSFNHWDENKVNIFNFLILSPACRGKNKKYLDVPNQSLESLLKKTCVEMLPKQRPQDSAL